MDTGVVRALAGRSRDPLERTERGPLLETFIPHELSLLEAGIVGRAVDVYEGAAPLRVERST